MKQLLDLLSIKYNNYNDLALEEYKRIELRR